MKITFIDGKTYAQIETDRDFEAIMSILKNRESMALAKEGREEKVYRRSAWKGKHAVQCVQCDFRGKNIKIHIMRKHDKRAWGTRWGLTHA